jgi:hypothetical protein
MAFVPDLQELGGDRLDIAPQDECGLLDISHALASLDDATMVYFAAVRSAPARRTASPSIMGLTTMCANNKANLSGSPSLAG